MSNLIAVAQFRAPWWALPINPAFLPRRALWNAMTKAVPLVQGRLLDVGCGSKPYRELFTEVKEYLGLELDTEENRLSKQADIYYDGDRFPLADSSFDVLLCNQVLEHIFDQKRFISEIIRVLRPGGTLILTVPFLWPEHEQPYDCLRYTSFGLRNLLENAGLRIDRQTKLMPGNGALCALAADRINTALRPAPIMLRLLGRAILIAPLSLLGWVLASISPSDSALYLDNFVICQKPA